MNNICVFCGSSSGNKACYTDAAIALGDELVRRGIGLVYGGGRVGLMGTIADRVIAGGGRVIGVIPESLDPKERAHHGISKLHVVDSMHERKGLMADLSDGFITLPGGLGTMEEFFEVTSWGVLGIHRKPNGLFNVEGYYNPILEALDRFVSEGFARPEYRAFVVDSTDAAVLIDKLDRFQPPPLHRWLVSNER